jgi:hypothetical protein
MGRGVISVNSALPLPIMTLSQVPRVQMASLSSKDSGVGISVSALPVKNVGIGGVFGFSDCHSWKLTVPLYPSLTWAL